MIDKDGGFTDYTSVIDILNVAPTGTLGGTSSNEGSGAGVAFTNLTDPSVPDLASLRFSYDFDNNGVFDTGNGTYAGSVASSSVSLPAAMQDGPATRTVRGRVIDKDGGFTDYTVTLTIDNVAPTATFSNSGSVNEGAAGATVSFSSPIDPSSADVAAGFRYAYDFDNDGTFDVGTGVNATSSTSTSGSVPASLLTDGPATRTVRGRIIDKNGGFTDYTTSITINNVAPSVAANNASVTLNEGQTATNSGTFSDPGVDTVTITASVGTISTGSGTWSWSFNTNDGPDQTQTVTITATDSDGAASTTTFALVVNNVAPSVARNTATVTVNEGAIASNTGTWSDPGLDVVTLSASVGTVTQNVNGTWSWSFNTSDGPAQGQTVTITATDSDGAATATTFALVVNNVAPTASLSNGGAVNEGTTGTVSFVAQADPSSVDTSAGFHYAYDFDNNGTFDSGNGTFAGSGSIASATFPASFLVGAGGHVIRGRIIDKDGGFSDYLTTITFVGTTTNVPPVITAISNSSPDCGETKFGDQVKVSATFTDANAADIHAAIINWGDGVTTTGTVLEPNGAGTVRGSHADATGGFFTITVTVTDNLGAAATRTTDTVIAGVRLLPNGQILIIGTQYRDHVLVHKSGQNKIEVNLHLGHQGGGESDEDEGHDFEDGHGSDGHGSRDDGSDHHDSDHRDSAGDGKDDSFKFTFNRLIVTGIVMYLCEGDDHAVIGGGEGNSEDGFEIPSTIYGEGGNDHLEGGNGADLLDGGSGNDKLHGGKGNDTLLGGTGNDRFMGYQGNDVLVGGDGNDTL